STGVEAEARWSGFGGMLTLAVNSTWTDARKTSEDYPGDPTTYKKLIYVPPQTFSAWAAVELGDLRLFVEHSWSSYRYTTESNDAYVSSYSVTSATAAYRFPLGSVRLFLKGELTNIFRTQYEVLALYPMPLQEFRVTAGGEL
ncbi:TonB-dependent receptor, partial [bacterium]|nr:TonB-dependent receptor [bacterium]